MEELVNSAIEKKLEVHFEQLPKEKALELVPFAAFEEKYGDSVKVYYVGEKKIPFQLKYVTDLMLKTLPY